MKKLLLLLVFCTSCSVPEAIAYLKFRTWYSNTTDPNLGHVESICKPQDPEHKEVAHCALIENTKCASCCDVCGDYRTE